MNSTAESLIESGHRVTIIEKETHVLINLLDKDMARKIENELGQKGIKVITGINITEIIRKKDGFEIATASGNFMANVIVLTAGVRPNNSLARKAGLSIGKTRGIIVDTRMKTSDDSIYAAGDCVESINIVSGKLEYWPLGSVSMKMARIVADNIAGIDSEFHGSLGTAMFRIVDFPRGLIKPTGTLLPEDIETYLYLRAAIYPGGNEYLFENILAGKDENDPHTGF